MSIKSVHAGSTRGLYRCGIFALLAISLSGCAAGPIAGAAVSLASGTLTAASDVTSNVVAGTAEIVSDGKSQKAAE